MTVDISRLPPCLCGYLETLQLSKTPSRLGMRRSFDMKSGDVIQVLNHGLIYSQINGHVIASQMDEGTAGRCQEVHAAGPSPKMSEGSASHPSFRFDSSINHSPAYGFDHGYPCPVLHVQAPTQGTGIWARIGGARGITSRWNRGDAEVEAAWRRSNVRRREGGAEWVVREIGVAQGLPIAFVSLSASHSRVNNSLLVPQGGPGALSPSGFWGAM
ncbi:hypothetical protein IMY05_C4449001500 [Salix suchowensis]|nr:hypothetical protein IMY05_C4449001500 [Salix suchowensis]